MPFEQAYSAEQALAAQDSRLLDLPAELRNRIYSYAFDCAPDMIVVMGSRLARYGDMKICCTSPPLLQICHQIRQEAISIYYPEQNFLVDYVERLLEYRDARNPAKRWLKSLTEANRAQLRRIYMLTSVKFPTEQSAISDIERITAEFAQEGINVAKHALHVAFWKGPRDSRAEGDGLHWMHLEGTDVPQVTKVGMPLDIEECPHLCNHTYYDAQRGIRQGWFSWDDRTDSAPRLSLSKLLSQAIDDQDEDG